MTSPTATQHLFAPIVGDRRSAAITAQVREAILRRRLRPGDRLPPELELAKTFGVSPIVLRGAVHVLEASGLVVVRRGATGGVFVADFDHRAVTESLATLLRVRRTSLQEITEARLVIEPQVAERAARRWRADDLTALAQNLEGAAAGARGVRRARVLHLQFHKLIAALSGNAFFAACVSSLVDSLEGSISYMDSDVGSVSVTLEHHRAIYRALKRRNGRLAARCMRRHILQVQRGVEQRRGR